MTEEFNESMINEVQEGDKVKGTVQQIEDKHVVVHIDGGKFDGIIPISQLSTQHIETANEVVNIGDEIEAFVTKIEQNEESGHYILSKRKLDENLSYDKLQKIQENDETIEAEVTEVVKGGLVVDAGIRGFIPASLISVHYIEDFSDYLGKVLTLKVEELDQTNNRVILSHKKVEQESLDVKKEALLDNLSQGDILEGRVARIANFGAFIDLGGVDGLVHVSELSHNHVKTPDEVVQVGDNVKVKVRAVDREAERISLSIKDTLPSPFEQIESEFNVGDIVPGKVVRLAQFGAFVEIAAGLQGLVHISQISHEHIGNPEEVLEKGQNVQVKILGIDKDEERISLSIKDTIEQETDYDESYLNQSDSDEDNPTLGDVFGDKLKNFKL
ncbi:MULTISPECIES: 30S ribosomal protein S1 [Mammaliicoccus]|jgi:small subunit ribosomal protein S1|uniref:Small ribosomal subunit protein bS1 n=1 Tax=Mammaliicoccus lentus TaxID=42858 RepID=A0AAP1RT75_MAMLE|nr:MULTISPECIES: 30S ribosomal protein S1 [Mammaliicoccus]MBF0747838.1 30S ribosomal protein S1 [Mammaliicoccus lentus]MBF0793190.1 30S ribosomal protein S1 [Mammaliicoccus lentus]MBF0842223.1 30S ribosomal protein S1 [Mammaliicoccus lentus]MBU6113943.1 30S ribosomal protein S1 [Mammaliicoccus lentus]MBW0761548.1 30S ribosomal protein S1 [Mammaliicoccus lentus]